MAFGYDDLAMYGLPALFGFLGGMGRNTQNPRNNMGTFKGTGVTDPRNMLSSATYGIENLSDMLGGQLAQGVQLPGVPGGQLPGFQMGGSMPMPIGISGRTGIEGVKLPGLNFPSPAAPIDRALGGIFTPQHGHQPFYTSPAPARTGGNRTDEVRNSLGTERRRPESTPPTGYVDTGRGGMNEAVQAAQLLYDTLSQRRR